MKYKYERLIRTHEPVRNVEHNLFFNALKRFGAKGYRVIRTSEFGAFTEYLLMKKDKDKKHPLKDKERTT